MDAPAFMAWLHGARPGDAVEYHRGFLAKDKQSDGPFCGYTALQEDLRALARAALHAEESSLVHLVQRKWGAGDYSYYAVKAAY